MQCKKVERKGFLNTKCRRGTGRPVVTLQDAEPRLSRPGRRRWFAAAGTRSRPKPRNERRPGVPVPTAKGSGIRVLQGVRGRRTRSALAPRTTLLTERELTDTAARPPRAQWSRRVQRLGGRFLSDRGVVDGSRTRDTQVKHLVLCPLSYHDQVPPRFRFPARNTPCPTPEDVASEPRA